MSNGSFVQLDNIQTVATSRFVKGIGTLGAATMQSVCRTPILSLWLEGSI